VVRCVWLKGEGEGLVKKLFHEAMEVKSNSDMKSIQQNEIT
jgi:hypothetical protein